MGMVQKEQEAEEQKKCKGCMQEYSEEDRAAKSCRTMMRLVSCF
jgi:hypothetical protein